jgi:hypothetical protein
VSDLADGADGADREEIPDYGTPDPETGLEEHDINLIRWMLSLPPVERLRYAQRFAAGAEQLRRAPRA